MSFPYFFDPVTLWFSDAARSERRPHVIVDGGLLSNFPVWLFDSEPQNGGASRRRRIRRPTYGFRLHPGAGPEQFPYRAVRRFGWPVSLTRGIFMAAMEAWDRRMMSVTTDVRTVSIPTGDIRTLDFELAGNKPQRLFDSGYRQTERFLLSQPEYRNTLGVTGPGPAVTLRHP
jgi:NTE family protein